MGKWSKGRRNRVKKCVCKETDFNMRCRRKGYLPGGESNKSWNSKSTGILGKGDTVVGMKPRKA